MAATAQLTTNALFAGNNFGQTNQVWRYQEVAPGVLRCLDWPEDQPLPSSASA